MTKDQREYWNQQAPIYASSLKFHQFIELYEENCWRYIETVLPEVEGSTILEAGCGTGRWVVKLAPMGYRVVLSDLSSEMIQQARTKVERLGLSDCVKAYHTFDLCDMHMLSNNSFDLVLALGGPLSLCRDAKTAVSELLRVTKPGGHVICDGANRYRTALDLVRQKEFDQVTNVLDTGQFSRPEGLTDHRFTPREFTNLFEEKEMKVICMAAVCPFMDYLPSKEQVRMLDDKQVFELMLNVGRRYAEDASVISLSGRLLIVARKEEQGR